MSAGPTSEDAHGPLVSILIPLYNGAPVLAQTLESVRAQTYGHWQAIVVDDGSTDDSARIAREFAARDPRFEVTAQPNAGTQGARNTALRHARGTLVALLDQDDVWMPDKLAKQVEIHRAHPDASLIFSNYLDWDGESDVGPRYTSPDKVPDGDVTRGLVRACLFGAATVVVPKPILDAVGPFDEELVHTGDWDMWLRVAEYASRHGGFSARGTCEPLMRYRLWPGNASADRVRMARGTLRVMEKALARQQSEAFRAQYVASHRRAGTALQLSQTRALLDEQTETGTVNSSQARRQIGRGLVAAWKGERKTKYLTWALACAWPTFLGGAMLSRGVHRRLRRKW